MVRWVASPVPRCLAEGARPQLPPADRRPELFLSKEEVPHPLLLDAAQTESHIGVKLLMQVQEVKEKEAN